MFAFPFQAGVFEVLLLRLAILFDTEKKSLMLLNGSIYWRDGCSSSASTPNVLGQGHFLVDSLFDFVDRFNILNLNDADIAMFCAVVLISPGNNWTKNCLKVLKKRLQKCFSFLIDRPGLRNPELVEKMNEKLKRALHKVLQMHHHPNDRGLGNSLLLKIPDLRTLNTLHSEKLLAFKMDPHEKVMKLSRLST